MTPTRAHENGANDYTTLKLEFGTIHNNSKAATNYTAASTTPEKDILDYTNGINPTYLANIKGLLIVSSSPDTLGQTSTVNH